MHWLLKSSHKLYSLVYTVILRRLQHVIQQVSGEKVAAKLLEHLSLCKANAAFVTSLGTVLINLHTPQPPSKLSTCTRCGERYDPNYNSVDCKQN